MEELSLKILGAFLTLSPVWIMIVILIFYMVRWQAVASAQRQQLKSNFEQLQASVQETRRTNEYLERIAVALERRAS